MAINLTVVISDLHLGRGNGADDFVRDEEFFDFCEVLLDQTGEGQLKLVLNGDVIDLWEIAPDAELGVDAASLQAIRNHIISPQNNDHLESYSQK